MEAAPLLGTSLLVLLLGGYHPVGASGSFQFTENGSLVQKESDSLFKEVPIHNGIQIVVIHRTESQSLHWVRVWTQERPHLHATHDSTVELQQGQGTLYLNGVPLHLKPGDVTMIPRGTPHYFVNETSGTYSQAQVVFSPPFDGKDVVPAP